MSDGLTKILAEDSFLFSRMLLLRRLTIVLIGVLLPVTTTAQRATERRVVRVTLLHVNDVYQINPVDRGTRGGLARLKTLRQQIAVESPNTLLLLAGNTISPSVESITYKGAQMIEAWNDVGLDFAVFGNHEFDFGPDLLRERVRESRFKWLGTNVVDKTAGEAFAGTPFVIREFKGVKVGFAGFLMPATEMTSRPGPSVQILDPCETAKRVVPEIRARGAQVVIGLTHLTDREDRDLARCAAFDVIIGGYERTLLQSVTAGTPIFKMTSNAREVGRIDLDIDAETGKLDSLKWEVIPVTNEIADDPGFVARISSKYRELSSHLDKVIGRTAVLLDVRSACNRNRETNIGNFIADAYRTATGADVGFINGGGIRADAKILPGVLTERDILSIDPFRNRVVKVAVTGATLLQVLEHGVALSGQDAEPGRFPQVSGIRFRFRTDRPPGSRVDAVTVGGKPLDVNKTYTLAVTDFIAVLGGDGYDMFRGARLLITPEHAQISLDILRKAISSVRAIAPRVEGRIIRNENTGTGLTSSMSCVYEKFNDNAVQLKPLRGTLPNGNTVSGYDADKVKAIIEEARSGILNNLNDSKLGAMRAYVESNFPRATNLPTVLATVDEPVARVDYRPPQFALSSHHAAGFGEEKRLSPPGPTEAALNNTRTFLADVQSNTDAIVFQVQSFPPGANVVLTPAYGDARIAPTPGEIPNFYRGKYSVTVTKPGYKTIRQPSQNFWREVIGLKCSLRSNQEAGEPLFCEMIKRK